MASFSQAGILTGGGEGFRDYDMMCSGSSTGEAACPGQLDLVLGGVPDTPVLIGSGVTTQNLAQFSRAHGLIVGSYFDTVLSPA